jgi:REP element-mobilizing transposase RayT
MKYLGKRGFGVLRRHLGELFHELASHKELQIVEGHLMGDHVRMCISIPPKYAVSNVVGYPSDLYDDTLRDWKRVERPHHAVGSTRLRTEVLWISPRAAEAL